jgi:molecular chaperone GrpE
MAEDTLVQGIEDTELRDWRHKGPKDAEARQKEGGSDGAAPQKAETNDGIVEPAVAWQAELEQMRGERDQLMDRLARMQAEFENTRRREVKERADLRDYAVQGAVEPFLGVMDNFQLALKSEGTLEQLRAGVELILKQMEEALKGLHVQPVETVGVMFDPRVHEALGRVETVEFPDHQVLEEVRRGYKIRDKLLRPALVRIASNTAVVSN